MIISKIKNRLKWVISFPLDFILGIIYRKPIIKNIEDTIEKIIKDKSSVARYGDGELNLAFGKSIDFQQSSGEIQRELVKILSTDDENFMVCLPRELYYSDENIKISANKYWKKFIRENRAKINKILKKGKVYYSTSMTRFYLHFNDKTRSYYYAELLKNIWEDRDVVFVEGKKSRLGVGNDFFDNAKSVRRILCPENQAFDVYNEILSAINSNVEKGALILLALGPTATIMAYDLYKCGYQAIDVGHVDIEYEWMRMGATEKVAIKGKYVNEVEEGKIVEEESDAKYFSQIIKRVEL